MEKNPLNDIIARTCTDKSFRRELLSDPAGVLRRAGIEVPRGIGIRVIENTDEKVYLVLPASQDERPAAGRPRPGEEARTSDLLMKWSLHGLDLIGRITVEGAQALRLELDKVGEDLTIDFEKVSFMGSAGLAVLLATRKRLAAEGKELCLCDVQPAVRNIFSLSGMDSFFKIILGKPTVLPHESQGSALPGVPENFPSVSRSKFTEKKTSGRINIKV